MQTPRSYSLAFITLLLGACGDSGGKLTGGPADGQLSGGCISGLCAPGLICSVDLCISPGGGNNTGNSSGSATGNTGETTDDGATPTSSGTTGDDPLTTTNVSTNVTTATSDATTTGVDTATTTTAGTTNTTNTTNTTRPDTSTTDPETSDGSDSRGFIDPPDPGECDGDICTADELCVLVGDMNLCLAICDPLVLADCAAEEMCSPEGDQFVCAPDASGNTGAVGDGCAYANGCDPGNVCLNGEYVPGCNGMACCSMFCDTDLADPCVQYGMTCVAWYEQGMAPAGLEDVGVCILQ